MKKSPGIESLMFAACLLVPTAAVHAEEWDWLLTPYLWGIEPSLDVTVNDEVDLGGDADFSDVLDKLEMTAMIHFQGMRGRFGFFTDLAYLETSDQSSSASRLALPGTRSFLRDTDLELTLFEAAGLYRAWGGKGSQTLDLIVGVRGLDLDYDLDVESLPNGNFQRSYTVSDTYYDGFVGVHYMVPLNENWTMSLRADAGTGDTDYSWSANALLEYHFGRDSQYGALLGYRYLDMQFDHSSDGQDIESDLTIEGFMLGFAFRF